MSSGMCVFGCNKIKRFLNMCIKFKKEADIQTPGSLVSPKGPISQNRAWIKISFQKRSENRN